MTHILHLSRLIIERRKAKEKRNVNRLTKIFKNIPKGDIAVLVNFVLFVRAF